MVFVCDLGLLLGFLVATVFGRVDSGYDLLLWCGQLVVLVVSLVLIDLIGYVTCGTGLLFVMFWCCFSGGWVY